MVKPYQETSGTFGFDPFSLTGPSQFFLLEDSSGFLTQETQFLLVIEGNSAEDRIIYEETIGVNPTPIYEED